MFQPAAGDLPYLAPRRGGNFNHHASRPSAFGQVAIPCRMDRYSRRASGRRFDRHLHSGIGCQIRNFFQTSFEGFRSPTLRSCITLCFELPLKFCKQCMLPASGLKCFTELEDINILMRQDWLFSFLTDALPSERKQDQIGWPPRTAYSSSTGADGVKAVTRGG